MAECELKEAIECDDVGCDTIANTNRKYKQTTTNTKRRRLLNVVMLAAIQMTEPEMSCDGCYHLIQVRMEYKYKHFQKRIHQQMKYKYKHIQKQIQSKYTTQTYFGKCCFAEDTLRGMLLQYLKCCTMFNLNTLVGEFLHGLQRKRLRRDAGVVWWGTAGVQC